MEQRATEFTMDKEYPQFDTLNTRDEIASAYAELRANNSFLKNSYADLQVF